MILFRIILFGVLFLLSANSVKAQLNSIFSFSSSIIEPSKSDSLLSFLKTPIYHSSLAFNSKTKRFYLKLDSKIITIDTKTRQFQRQQTTLDMELGRMFVDTTTNKILIWDFSVGRVVEWDPETNTSIRKDNSFQHKNQYYHASWVEPRTKDIYAFGGYGLFSYKNFTTVFNQKQKEWFLIKDFEGKPRPLISYNVAQISNSTLIMQSNNVFFNGDGGMDTLHQANLIQWHYEIASHKWKMQSYLSDKNFGKTLLRAIQPSFPLNTAPTTENYTDSYSSFVQDEESGLKLIFTFILEDNNNVGLLLSNPLNGKMALVKIPALSPVPVIVLRPYYAPSEKAFYFIGFSSLSTTSNNPIIFYKATLNKFSELFDFVETNNIASFDFDTILSNKSIYANFYIGLSILFLGLFLGWFGFSFPKKKKQNKLQTVDSDSEKLPNPVKNHPKGKLQLKLLLDNQLIVVFDNKTINDDFRTDELRVLQLFAEAKSKNIDFLVTDELNALFESSFSTIDYARKQRNIHIQKLEASLQRIAPSKETYIVNKKNFKDFRKIDYSLNWNQVDWLT